MDTQKQNLSKIEKSLLAEPARVKTEAPRQSVIQTQLDASDLKPITKQNEAEKAEKKTVL